MKLSLCMIVKNEEATIAQCLKSVHTAVDEMIIVDTGSTDQTITLCEAYGATVLHYEWNQDFAAARNFGIAHATGDWILWMDADEVVDAEDGNKLKQAIQTEEYDFLSIHLINYFGERVHPNETYHIAHTRLFRNGKGYQFVGAIHETLDIQGHSAFPMKDIRIHHYGYTTPQVQIKKKFERNVSMLEEELKKAEFDPWIPYHLAAELYNTEQYEKSFEYVNMAILKFISSGWAPPSLLYKLKYGALLNLGSLNGAWPGIQKAIDMYPDYVDLHFYKGLILFGKENYEDALDAFNQCLELGENHLQHLVMKGTGSFMALYYKGQVYEKLNQPELALDFYRLAIGVAVDYEPALEAIVRLQPPQA